MITYWTPHAHLPDRVADAVMITVDGGVISAVTTGVPASVADVRLDGVLLPGLANAHSHAFHRALRGRTHGGGGTFWTWRQQMYAVAACLDPDRYHALARAAYAEMTLAGITAVGEFHYLHHDHRGRPYTDPNAMSAALVAAATDAGLRLTLLDACYLSGGLVGDGHLPLDPVQQRFGDGSVEAWADRVSAFAETCSTAPTARVASAVHSVRAVPADDLARLAARRPVGPLHVHLSEQQAENDATLAFYGCTPTVLLHRQGLLGSDTTAVHATHLTADDVDLLGRTGTGACFCPTTERDLADGIGPARALADAGCPLSLGSDQHAVIDPFEEIRGLELHERLASRERGRFTPVELITAASAAGYTSLGWDGGGRLAVGAPADFVAVDAGSVRTTGVRPDQILYAATAADVCDVVVAGEHVVRAGRHRLGDVADLLRTALADLEDS